MGLYLGGLIFGRIFVPVSEIWGAYLFIYLLLFFFWGGGGAYYQNFMVSKVRIFYVFLEQSTL